MLVISPFMAIGQMVQIHFQKGLTDAANDLTKEADLLANDAISNFKTVQSFANEDMIFARYKMLMDPVNAVTVSQNIKIGSGFGLAQFCMFATMAGMFWSAGTIMETYWSIDMNDVMAALFAIMFGAMQAGNAAAFGPDMGKAQMAAERVFKIIDYPSQINARATVDKGIKVNAETFMGKIEFKEVWFRYPRRKEDFVLRGLNLTINPKESIALVGESGCGKSTFVNLVMRFYDVDSGEVLIDGVNIKDYDLHSLRDYISMVMQEPIIFNYSILENVLYGRPNAKNSEVLEACELANCMDFIEKNASGGDMEFDDSAQALLKEMADNKDKIIAQIGEQHYKEEINLLE
jgi:ATP-binding cassette subfamily B (MDR/TAP) protein 1